VRHFVGPRSPCSLTSCTNVVEIVPASSPPVWLGVAWSCLVVIGPDRTHHRVGKTPRKRAICAWRGSRPLSRVPTTRADLATGPVQGHAPFGTAARDACVRAPTCNRPGGCVSSVAAVVTAPWTRSEAGQALGRAAGFVGRCVGCRRWRPRRGGEVLDDLATEQSAQDRSTGHAPDPLSLRVKAALSPATSRDCCFGR